MLTYLPHFSKILEEELVRSPLHATEISTHFCFTCRFLSSKGSGQFVSKDTLSPVTTSPTPVPAHTCSLSSGSYWVGVVIFGELWMPPAAPSKRSGEVEKGPQGSGPLKQQHRHRLELTRNAESWAPPQTSWSRNSRGRPSLLCCNRPPDDSDSHSGLRTTGLGEPIFEQELLAG